MSQHRSGLHRVGNRWCSADALKRLEREAETSDDPRDQERLKRARVRCGIIQRPPNIKKETKAGFGRLQPEDEELQDLIVSVIESASQDGLDWRLSSSLGINMFRGKAIRSWDVGMDVPYSRRKESLSVTKDYNRVLSALQKISKKKGWKDTSGWVGDSGDYGHITVAPKGMFG